MRIDIHNHFAPEKVIQEMEKRGMRYGIKIKRNPDGFGQLIQNGDKLHMFTKDFTDPLQRLKDMDAAGLDKAAVSLSTPGAFLGGCTVWARAQPYHQRRTRQDCA